MKDKHLLLKPEEVRYLRVYLPKMKASDDCPPDMVKSLYKIRDNIMSKLKR